MQIEKGKLRQYLNLNAKFSITYAHSETEKLWSELTLSWQAAGSGIPEIKTILSGTAQRIS